MKMLILTLALISFNAFSEDYTAIEKCTEFTNKLLSESLIAVNEQKAMDAARDSFMNDRTDENRQKMYDALKKVHEISTKTNDLCIENFSQK